MTIRQKIEEIKTRLSFVEPSELLTGPLVIDVREQDETADGVIPGALIIPKGVIEMRIEAHSPVHAPITLYCATDARSTLAALSLKELGYTNVSVLRGGFSRWKTEGREIEIPMQLGADERVRYSRHLRIPEVGESGQAKLRSARILMLGAGGLGSPAGLYLAAAGVGCLGVIDSDIVDKSNLQRQVIHNESRLGMRKVDSAEVAIRALNSGVKVEKFQTRLDGANVAEILGLGWDAILDGGDNFSTRYILNDAAVSHRIPLIHGSVYRFEGQATTFIPGKGPCYRCLYPEPPPPELAPSCQEAGVLGVVPGVVGLLQALEALKLVVGFGEPLIGRLLMFDAKTTRLREVRIGRDPECPVCASIR